VGLGEIVDEYWVELAGTELEVENDGEEAVLEGHLCIAEMRCSSLVSFILKSERCRSQCRRMNVKVEHDNWRVRAKLRDRW
jgi:hypothetical protein